MFDVITKILSIIMILSVFIICNRVLIVETKDKKTIDKIFIIAAIICLEILLTMSVYVV